MNATSRYAALVFALAGTFLTAGCFASKCEEQQQQADGGFTTVDKDNCVQFEPGRFYEGTAATGNQTWASGGTVTIQNGNGGTTVRAHGAAGSVSFSAVPFDFEKANSEGQQAAVAYISQMPQPGIAGDGTSVNINAAGSGAHGYHMTVTVPTDFNGTIIVKEGNGDVTINPAGGATQVTADTKVGDITVSGLAGGLTLTTGNGDIVLSGAPTGGTAKTELGDVGITIVGTPNVAIMATATQTVDVTNPGAWSVQEAAVNSKTVQIGTPSGATLTVDTKLGKVTIGG